MTERWSVGKDFRGLGNTLKNVYSSVNTTPIFESPFSGGTSIGLALTEVFGAGTAAGLIAGGIDYLIFGATHDLLAQALNSVPLAILTIGGGIGAIAALVSGAGLALTEIVLPAAIATGGALGIAGKHALVRPVRHLIKR